MTATATPSGERRPDVVAVEPDASATSWPTVRVSGGSGGGSGSSLTRPDAAATSRGSARASVANASSKRQRARSGSSISFETTRTSTAGTPGELARAQDGEALHRLDVDAVRAADAGARPDRAARRFGNAVAQPLEQARVGRTRRGHERSGGVAVDRLGAEHERERRKPARPGDADVEDGVRPLLGERAGRGGGGLDRPDPAHERPAPVDRRELPLGRGDDETPADQVRSATGRRARRRAARPRRRARRSRRGRPTRSPGRRCRSRAATRAPPAAPSRPPASRSRYGSTSASPSSR